MNRLMAEVADCELICLHEMLRPAQKQVARSALSVLWLLRFGLIQRSRGVETDNTQI